MTDAFEFTLQIDDAEAVTYASPSITSLLSGTPNDVVGKQLDALVHPDDIGALRQALDAIKQAPDSSARAEYRLRSADGSWRCVEGEGTTLAAPPHTHAISLRVRDITERKLTQRLMWSDSDATEHSVQFYETDEFLVDALRESVRASLAAGDACIVIATSSHREQLERRLWASDTEMAAHQARGAYTSRDASETLARFMVDGMPDPGRFADVVRTLIARASRSGRHVRVFGEMVARLWMEGRHEAAIHLEELWNDLLAGPHPFSLVCAYPAQGFAGSTYVSLFAEICQRHSRVIPDESYTALTSAEERLHAITLLQQKAHSLESEVAERKLTEDRLRVSEHRYRRLFEASTDGILIIDPASQAITDANPALTSLLGRTREQVVGHELWQIGLFPTGKAARDVMRDLREKPVVHFDDMPLQTKDGHDRYIAIVCTRFLADGHDIIQCNARDITDSHRAAQALERERLLVEREEARAEALALQMANLRMDEFLGIASHEMRTPLTIVKANVQMAERQAKSLAQQATDADHARLEQHVQSLRTILGRARSAIGRQERLVNDLLDVSRIQEGELDVRPNLCDLGEIARECVDEASITHANRVVEISAPNHPVRITADHDRIYQVIESYVGNALKYSGVQAPVTVRLRVRDGVARLSVTDNGPGLPQQELTRVWERFYRSPEVGHHGGSGVGLGLGLFICRNIIELHGGAVGVESIAGQGSTFWFTLPLAGGD
jgi:PAS domain S-box-containing protein